MKSGRIWRVGVAIGAWVSLGLLFLGLVLFNLARTGSVLTSFGWLSLSFFVLWILISVVIWVWYIFYRDIRTRMLRLENRLASQESSSSLDDTVKEQLSRQVEEALEKPLTLLGDSLALMSRGMQELRLQDAAGVTWFESLYHIFQLLSEAETDEQLYEHIVTAFAILDGYTQVVLLLGRDELGPLYLVSALGMPPEVLTEWSGRPWRPPLWGVVAPALAKGKSFSAHEQPHSERSFKEEFPWPVRGTHITAIPLKGIESIQGVVLLARTGEPKVMTQVQTRLLDIVALFAGHTLESRQLARGVQTHITELVTIQSITRAMISATSLDTLVSTLGMEIGTVVGPSSVALILAEELETRQVHYAGAVELEEELLTTANWRVVQWVLEAGQPVFFNPGEVGEDVGDLMFETSGRAMAVPLEGPDRVLGVLVVVAQVPGRTFEEPQLVGVRTIANAAVVGLYAIRYRSLMQEARRQVRS